jgi:predicted secreted Zn-dependent protease
MRLAGLAFFAVILAACSSGGSSEPPDLAVPVSTAVSVTSESSAAAEIDRARVELETTLSTTYYDVGGTTTEAIFSSIEANGPRDTAGRQGSGLTSVDWEYVWSGEREASGTCRIRELTISADVTIELPRHIDESSLTETLRANWQTYAEGVAVHEQRHVDIYLAGAETIRTALTALGSEATCEALESRIDGVWANEQAQINALQEIFHSEEDARLAAQRGPLELSIEANRAELDSLRSRIYELDQEITRLRAEIEVFDNEVAMIDAQIKQINDQFPSDLPETVKQRLEALIAQSNDLLFTYNQRVDEHNATIHVRNAMSDEYDTLLLATNQLVDDYNWTR